MRKFKKLIRFLRDNLITGTLVLAPFGAVIWMVIWFWGLIHGLTDFLPEALDPRSYVDPSSTFLLASLNLFSTFVILGVCALLISLIGLVSRNYLGKRILQSIRRFVSRLPVLRAVYSTLEQLLKTFGSGQNKNFRKVVLIEYPKPGLFTLALVTGEREIGLPSKTLTVFVPTTPNPTSGFYLMVEEKNTKAIDLTVEEALKEIISMGLVQK